MSTNGSRPRALVITRNLPPLVGGMERLLWHIVDELRAEYEVHVVGPRGCGEYLPADVNASEVPLRPLWRFLASAKFVSARLALRLKPQLVFAGSGLTAPAAWLAARLSGGHCVAYLHGLDIEAGHRLYHLLWHPFLRHCDRLLVNSSYTRRLAESVGIDPQRIEMLHPGVALPERVQAGLLRERFRQDHRLEDRPVMLYVGRITARKGLLPFVRDILPSIDAGIPSWRLVVIGSEPVDALAHKEEIGERLRDALQGNGLGDRITWLPHVDDRELTAAYFAADVMIFPVQELAGDHEGFGMVAMEAAAHGLPTVAFAAGGVTDAVANGRSGTLVRPGDNDAFAQATIALLGAAPGERTAMATSARAFASGFTWPDFGHRLNRLCRKRQAAES
jgi:phosphatidylinositol alpha-1,6-mannosyltransferase